MNSDEKNITLPKMADDKFDQSSLILCGARFLRPIQCSEMAIKT